MTNYSTIFTPSASVTITPAAFSQAFALSAADAGNLDLVVTNSCISQITLTWGSGSLAGAVTIPAGQTVMFSSNAATLAACLTNPAVISSTLPANATAVTAQAVAAGGTVTITRGTAISKLAF